MSSSDTRGRRTAPTAPHGGAAAWTIFVCAVLLLPGDLGPPATDFPWTWPAGSDKLGHGLLFFVETRFLVRSFRHLRPGPPPVAAAVVAAAALGGLTETAQLWVPYRDGSGADFLADALGACAYAAWRRIRGAWTGTTT